MEGQRNSINPLPQRSPQEELETRVLLEYSVDSRAAAAPPIHTGRG